MTETRLVLIRHAKTEQTGPPTQGDHGRRLLERGQADGLAAGRWLVEQGLVPDLVLCSSAMRARQTWQAMVEGHEALANVEVWHDPRIYNAAPDALFTVLAEVPPEVKTVALVGHAPGVPGLLAELADPARADHDAAESFNQGYPTMTLAVLHTDTALSDVRAESMALHRVHTARAADA